MQVQARTRPLALAAPQRDRFNKHRRPVVNPNESAPMHAAVSEHFPSKNDFDTHMLLIHFKTEK